MKPTSSLYSRPTFPSNHPGNFIHQTLADMMEKALSPRPLRTRNVSRTQNRELMTFPPTAFRGAIPRLRGKCEESPLPFWSSSISLRVRCDRNKSRVLTRIRRKLLTNRLRGSRHPLRNRDPVLFPGSDKWQGFLSAAENLIPSKLRQAGLYFSDVISMPITDSYMRGGQSCLGNNKLLKITRKSNSIIFKRCGQNCCLRYRFPKMIVSLSIRSWVWMDGSGDHNSNNRHGKKERGKGEWASSYFRMLVCWIDGPVRFHILSSHENNMGS